MTTETCDCGEWSGGYCSKVLTEEDMVAVNFIPVHLRESRKLALKSGVYPYRGSVVLFVHKDCAAIMLEQDPEGVSEVGD